MKNHICTTNQDLKVKGKHIAHMVLYSNINCAEHSWSDWMKHGIDTELVTVTNTIIPVEQLPL